MNVISFSAKMIGKWPTEPIISDFPIFGLCPQFNKSNILRRPKEYATQKVARPNGKGKRKGKGKKRNSELLIAKKQTNFGLCACTKFKYCNCYLIFKKSIFLVRKGSFSQKNHS